MADLASLFRGVARRAGRTVGVAGKVFADGRIAGSLPQDEAGRVQIVCRKAAERRAVALTEGQPACFDPESPACVSCLADIEDGIVETW